MTTITTRYEAVEQLVEMPIGDSGEDTAFFDIDAIADKTIASDTDENGAVYYYRAVAADEFWDVVMAHMYDVITYDAGHASTSSDTPEAKAYVEAFNLGEGEEFLTRTGARVEEISTHDGAASYERFIPATTLTAAHAKVLEAEKALAEARTDRDNLIAEHVESGVTMYSIAKDLGTIFGQKNALSQQAIAKIVNKNKDAGK